MQNLEGLLIESSVVIKGHFKLRSGKHSGSYINKDLIYSNPKLFALVLDELGKRVASLNFDILVGVPMAGIVLASPLSCVLDKILVYPDKVDNDEILFKRGYDKILKGKKVVIMEDIVTTGGSVNKTIKAITDCEGEVVGICSIWNRSPNINHFGSLPHNSLIEKEVLSYDPECCPFCSDKIVLTDPKK